MSDVLVQSKSVNKNLCCQLILFLLNECVYLYIFDSVDSKKCPYKPTLTVVCISCESW